MRKLVLVGISAAAMMLGTMAHAGAVSPGPIGDPPACDPDADSCDAGDGGTGTGTGGTGGGTTMPAPPVTAPAAFTGSGVQVYTSLAAFAAAAGTTVGDNFEFTPTNTTVPSMGFASNTYTDAAGITYAAAAPTPQPGFPAPVDLSLLDSTYLPSTGSYIGTHYGSDVLTSGYDALTFTFDHAVTAFGLDFGTFGRAFATQSGTLSFTVAGLGTQDVTSNAGSLKFFGFTSATPFTSVSLNASGVDNRVFDNVAISAAVPEAATWTMMVGGFGLVGAALRRRRGAMAVA